jgi:hypothetical protein
MVAHPAGHSFYQLDACNLRVIEARAVLEESGEFKGI